jgi:ferredoxin-nitrite reductase
MGDIGCLGTRTKISGESFDAYHIFVGGGFGRHQAVGRQVFAGVVAAELPATLERMLRTYLQHRQGHETFQQFTARHDVGRLQELFAAAG